MYQHFIAPLVKQCTGIAEVMGLVPVVKMQLLKLLINCEDHFKISRPVLILTLNQNPYQRKKGVV